MTKTISDNKSWIAITLGVAALSLFLSCARKEPERVLVWAFDDGFSKMLDYYEKSPAFDPKKATVQVEVVPLDVFQSRIDPLLEGGDSARAAGTELPDVFELDSSFVRKYVESGSLLDLSELKKDCSRLVPYTVDVGTDRKGQVVALSWEAAPGAFFYRRSLAKKYFDADTPEKMQARISDFDSFLDAAGALKDKSKGQAVMVSSLGELSRVYLAARQNPWVSNKHLLVDDKALYALDQCKVFQDSGYVGKEAQWGAGWFAGMHDELVENQGKVKVKGKVKDKVESVSVFGYFLPAWGLRYALKPNSASRKNKHDTAGDWAVIQGPQPYFWGGTWLAAYKGTKSKKAALDLIRYIATDPAFQEAWANDSGDFVSHLDVLQKTKDNRADAFLAGQNPEAVFAEAALKVNGKNLSAYDQVLAQLWDDQAQAFWAGDKSRDQAVVDFKSTALNQIPELTESP